MATTVTRNDENEQYEIAIDGTVVGHTDFSLRGTRLELVHTEVDPAYRGRDLAATLVREALDDARGRGYSVAPTCPYVARFIEEHPEYESLLTR